MEPDPDPPGLVPRFCGDEPPPLESLSLAQGPAEEGGSGGAAAGTAAGSDSTGAASAEQAQAVPASAGEGAAAAAAASAEAAAAAGDSKPGKQGGAGSSSGDGSAAGSTSQAKAAAGAASTTQAPPVKGVRHSKDICETYALMNACELLVHNMLRASGGWGLVDVGFKMPHGVHEEACCSRRAACAPPPGALGACTGCRDEGQTRARNRPARHHSSVSLAWRMPQSSCLLLVILCGMRHGSLPCCVVPAGRLPSFCPEAPSAASASASSSSPGPSIHTLPSTWADYKA